MIKTIKRAEVIALFQMLPKYFHFMRRNDRKTLLTRICGLYEVEFADSSERHTFVVTNSVFPAESASIITERFDLKGSTLGREASEAERITKGTSAVLKDLDLMKEVEWVKSHQTKNEADINGYGLHLGAVAKAALLTQIRKDVQLLVDCQVMDYSLLVGIASIDKNSFTEKEQRLVDAQLESETRLRLARRGRLIDALMFSLVRPAGVILAPPLYFYRKSWSVLRKSLFWPLPYYGSGDCGVDAGSLARLYGDRHGQRSLFYLGIIDFLQPFNLQKKAEWKMKAWMHKKGFSCVPPEDYANRFLAFLECNIS